MTIDSKASSRDQRGIRQKNFSGMNTVTSEDRLGLDEFREAVNVDITKEGRVTQRAGRRLMLTGANTGNMWSPNGIDVFFTALNKVRRFKAGEEIVSDVFVGIDPTADVGFCEVNGDVYFSDGKLGRIVRANGTVDPWGVKAPLKSPRVTATGVGNLEAGTYLISATCVTPSGEESGATIPVSITLLNGGGQLIVDGLVLPSDPRPLAFNIYISTPNGNVLYFVGTSTLYQGLFTISDLQSQSIELSTAFLSEMYPGNKLEHYRGVIYSALGPVLTWTEALRFGLTNLATNYLVFPADITVLASTENGLFVVADKTYFLTGRKPDDFEISSAADYGAPPGNYIRTEGTHFGLESNVQVVAWMSDAGLVMGTADGLIYNLTETRIAMQGYSSAATAYREEAGKRQIISAGMKSGQGNRMQVGDIAIAEVRRNGVIVG